MNAREKNLVILALLVSGAAGGGYWFYLRDNVKGQAEKAIIEKPPIPPPTKIRLDMMADEGAYGDAVNLFNYRKAKLEVAPPPPPPPLQAPPAAPPNVLGTGRGNAQPPTTPRPTNPVENVTPVNLVFSGFARDDSGEMVAFLETNGQGAPAGHFNLHEDDFLLGRFRIVKITDTTVEYEDWDRSEATRKQTPLALKKP